MKRLLLVLPILLGACSFSPSADVLKALAGDSNSLYVNVTTPWGGMVIDRNHGGPSNPGPTPAAAVVLPTMEMNPNGTVRSFGFTRAQ